MIAMHPVTSSNIAEIGFDENASVLYHKIWKNFWDIPREKRTTADWEKLLDIQFLVKQCPPPVYKLLIHCALINQFLLESR